MGKRSTEHFKREGSKGEIMIEKWMQGYHMSGVLRALVVMIAIWMNSWLLATCGFLFGIGHIVNSYSGYVQILKM